MRGWNDWRGPLALGLLLVAPATGAAQASRAANLDSLAQAIATSRQSVVRFVPPSLGQQVGMLVYVPDSLRTDSAARLPLVLFLHGAYEHGDGDRTLGRVLKHGPPKLVAQGRDFPFLLVSPQLPATLKRWPLALIADVLAEARRRWPVDSTRIYLTGLSDGGDASWAYAMAHPAEIAAIVPMAAEDSPEGICAMREVAVWAFHGARDSDTKPARAERLVGAYNACVPPPVEPARLTLVPGVTHNVWGQTYDGSIGYDIYAWLLAHHR